MSTGMLLSLILYKKKSISTLGFCLITFLFITVISVTGSINAWFVLLFGLLLAWIYGTKPRHVFYIAGLFVFFILFFPVSTNKLAIKNSNIFPLKNLLTGKMVKPDGENLLKNGSFETWGIFTELTYPRKWSVWFNKNNSYSPLLELRRDRIDGGLSVQMKTDAKGTNLNNSPDDNSCATIPDTIIGTSLIQSISPEKWQYLYGNYDELRVSSWVKTKSSNVLIGLYFTNDKQLYSKPHPGDGKWHELELKVKISELSENHRPVVMLTINKPDAEAIFDNTILEALGLKERTPVTTALGKEPDILDIDIVNKGGNNSLISFNSRVLLWKTTLKESPKVLFTGSGIQTFQASGIGKEILETGFLHAHNLFLNILAELGITGLLLAIIFICSLLKKAGWNKPIVIIPVILFFSGQMVDCFIHDFTFTTILLYFLAEAGNSKNKFVE